MTALSFPVEPIRPSLAEMEIETAWIATKPPKKADLVIVRDHAGALDPQRVLVVGDRGTGKSYWSATLTNTEGRAHIARRYPRLGLEKTHVSLGFSDATFKTRHPDAEKLATLRSQYSADIIWRTVVLDQSPYRPDGMPSEDWTKKVRWVADDEDGRSAAFEALDHRLSENGETYLAVFDALDRLAASWEDIRALTTGLLRLALDLRSLKRIKIKLFIRPDMADDGKLWAMGDASKLRHNEVKLLWKRRDLYNLLWMRLANHSEAGTAFRDEVGKIFYLSFVEEDGVYTPHGDLLENEDVQRAVFSAIAGLYMGANARRGRTYDWTPNHLANASGYATPRSFLIAMREAAKSTKNSSSTILDVSGIQQGVRQASYIRVDELKEDYGWIKTALDPLEGLIVPITKDELLGRWLFQKTLEKIKRGTEANQSGRYLPPVELSEEMGEREGLVALIQSLLHISVIEELSDDRLNMPDLFRIAAKVKRKGGVKLRP
ncbi:MAG TPA: hypothetical protein PKZ97_02930 [Azospirillaceae bacterium]|nr:hypothetical protein [Azospirillaceae bacterium]HRQ80049.1 hypothetical protein [Azospirillaceae bacterium]